MCVWARAYELWTCAVLFRLKAIVCANIVSNIMLSHIVCLFASLKKHIILFAVLLTHFYRHRSVLFICKSFSTYKLPLFALSLKFVSYMWTLSLLSQHHSSQPFSKYLLIVHLHIFIDAHLTSPHPSILY